MDGKVTRWPRSKIRVLIIGNYELDAQESMLRFGKLLEKELGEHNVRCSMCRPRPFLGRFSYAVKTLVKWLGYIDKFVIFPFVLVRWVRREQSEARKFGEEVIVHICDHSNAIYTLYLRQTPHLVTCNDLLAIRCAEGGIEENRTRWSGRILQQWIKNGLGRADRIVCISEATRTDLCSHAFVSSAKVSTIYMGLNFPYRPMLASGAQSVVSKMLKMHRGWKDNDTFILHVGGNQWYKNRLGVLSIYFALRREMLSLGWRHLPKLIMVGPTFTREMGAMIAAEKDGDEAVLSLTEVTNDELNAFYTSALLLLFPSLEEGFGWPIVEAQACGCPVVTTRKPPMTEVAGASAVYIPRMTRRSQGTDNVMVTTRTIINLICEDPAAKSARRKNGLENVIRFSAQAMVEKYISIYESLVNREVQVNRS